MAVERKKHCVGGVWKESKTEHWYDEASRKKAMDTWEGTVERI